MPQSRSATAAGSLPCWAHSAHPQPPATQTAVPLEQGQLCFSPCCFFCHGDQPTGSRGTSLPLHQGDGASLGSVFQSGIRKHPWDASSRSVSKPCSHSLGAGKAGEGSVSVVFSSRHLLVTPTGEQEQDRWGLVFSRRAARVIC